MIDIILRLCTEKGSEPANCTANCIHSGRKKGLSSWIRWIPGALCQPQSAQIWNLPVLHFLHFLDENGQTKTKLRCPPVIICFRFAPFTIVISTISHSEIGVTIKIRPNSSPFPEVYPAQRRGSTGRASNASCTGLASLVLLLAWGHDAERIPGLVNIQQWWVNHGLMMVSDG